MKMRRLSNRERRILRFTRYLEETFKNKLYATILIMLGIIPTKIDGDATFLVLMLMFGIPLFFARKNVVY